MKVVIVNYTIHTTFLFFSNIFLHPYMYDSLPGRFPNSPCQTPEHMRSRSSNLMDCRCSIQLTSRQGIVSEKSTNYREFVRVVVCMETCKKKVCVDGKKKSKQATFCVIGIFFLVFFYSIDIHTP